MEKELHALEWVGRWLGFCAAKDFRSPPPQKIRPEPVSKTARTLACLVLGYGLGPESIHQCCFLMND
jgi:hypothetical protein